MTVLPNSFGPYILRSEIGRGAMGVVYAAEQTALGRQVALKVMRPEFAQDVDYRQRFAREAASLARLDSPHVVQIFDFGEHESQLYIASQFIGGGDLERLIRSTAGIPVEQSLRLATQIASALRDAHDVQVIHRDVKPSNVLLRVSESPHSYLCDFGIARALDAESTATKGVVGTVSYMAPERFDGVAASPASDIYSLGCLLVTMLRGQAPYVGTSTEIMMKHVNHPIPVFASQSPIDTHINRILDRSMAKDPTRRYASARAMIADLSEASAVATSQRSRPTPGDIAAASDTVLTRPPQPVAHDVPPEVTPRRRSSWPAIAGGMAALALALALGWRVIPLMGEVESSNRTTTTPQPSSSPAANEAAGEANQPPADESATESPEQVTCWNGDSTASASACPELKGKAGLVWAMPSLDVGSPSCRSKGFSDESTAFVYACAFRVGGADGVYRYSYWPSIEDSIEHFEDRYAGSAGGRVDDRDPARQTWRLAGVNDTGDFRMSTAYSEAPFSVSVEATTADALDWAYGKLRFRTQSEIRSRLSAR